MSPSAPDEGTGVVGILRPGAGTKAALCVGLPTGGPVAFACFSSTVGAHVIQDALPTQCDSSVLQKTEF